MSKLDYITINGGELVPTETIKKLSPITDEERQSLSSLGTHIDADRFQTRVDYEDRSKGYIPETLSELTAQGLRLVAIDDVRQVMLPAQNIKKAANITDDDRAKFEKRTGNPMRSDFMSRVDTVAGAVLATIRADIVMKRKSGSVPNGPAAKSSDVPDPAEDTEPVATVSAAEQYGIA